MSAAYVNGLQSRGVSASKWQPSYYTLFAKNSQLKPLS